MFYLSYSINPPEGPKRLRCLKFYLCNAPSIPLRLNIETKYSLMMTRLPLQNGQFIIRYEPVCFSQRLCCLGVAFTLQQTKI